MNVPMNTAVRLLRRHLRPFRVAVAVVVALSALLLFQKARRTIEAVQTAWNRPQSIIILPNAHVHPSTSTASSMGRRRRGARRGYRREQEAREREKHKEGDFDEFLGVWRKACGVDADILEIPMFQLMLSNPVSCNPAPPPPISLLPFSCTRGSANDVHHSCCCTHAPVRHCSWEWVPAPIADASTPRCCEPERCYCFCFREQRHDRRSG